MNRLEARFQAEWLLPQHQRPLAGGWIAAHHYEAVTLQLGHDCRYTPDFVAEWHHTETARRTLAVYEVKGFRRDDGMVKLRVAATQFPWLRFNLVEWDKTALEWRLTRIPCANRDEDI